MTKRDNTEVTVLASDHVMCTSDVLTSSMEVNMKE